MELSTDGCVKSATVPSVYLRSRSGMTSGMPSVASRMGMDREADFESCPGSLDEPIRVLHPETSSLVGLCPVCECLVEVRPLEPGGAEVWRLEMHDRSGRTLRL